jgi:excinuclease ABC subunit C
MAYVMKNTEDESDENILKSFILQYYIDTSFYPDIVYVPLKFEEEDICNIEKVLSKLSKKNIKLYNPKRGKNFKLLNLSEKNAIAKLVDEKIKMQKYTDRVKNSVIELQKKLNLPDIPYIIEGFDNSTLQGTDTVASMVHFENGYPKKSQYRKFIIKSIDKQDDFQSMFEVVTRRYKRLLEEKGKIPDLILIDGGK